MLETIAIDDEPMALGLIRNFSALVPEIRLWACFTNAFEAIDFLRRTRVGLIFLDIRMPDVGGIDLLNGLTKPPLVIFTTAYSEHAVQSFELNAVDYLLKPFSEERFQQACQKALNLHRWRENEQAVPATHFFLKSGYERLRIAYDEVLYAESTGNYIQFVLINGKHITSRLTMADAENLLMPPAFIRIHRRFIAARKHITLADQKKIVLAGMKLPVSETYAGIIKKSFGK
ncbi:LytTR family DNA-binding domain-containing protein [Chitinophaga sp. 212800010-3]|uniref:LytR/AlgR family response regulator transcription factor n=1 Tax=unclassified Chitinophaga TaxID=2619133 RepID=UPI002DEAC546|nr:putative transcriptional regulatory protein YehT [Chitinophaga sp. 212800010-3]